MNVLDLFSGIGGFSLGLERAGMRTVAFCEIEPFARSVLAKHWPGVPCYDDVRTLTAERLAADGIGVDVICGGFPCQDISVAGKGAGLAGERSGLWSEYARIIGELRPSYVIVENVSGLLGRGLDQVLADLAALGFDAEWHCIPASAIGAPHRRDRIWIVAYPHDDPGARQRQHSGEVLPEEKSIRSGGSSGLVADAGSDGWPWSRAAGSGEQAAPGNNFWETLARSIDRAGSDRGPWKFEPNVGRVAHGVSNRAHRLRGLGNAVVPQIPEIIGHAIMKSRVSI